MQKLGILHLLPLLFQPPVAFAIEDKVAREVRTYMPFTFPVDPARIHTLPDRDIAFALSGTLLERDEGQKISAGLAESWRVISPGTLRITLKPRKWSNGDVLSSSDVRRSIERSLKVHPEELTGLAQLLDRIECPTNRDVDFKLKAAGLISQLLPKLTDPKLGIVRLKNQGNKKGTEIDLSVTCGHFSLLPASNAEQITLIRNLATKASEREGSYVDQVVIRKPPKGMESPKVLLEDSWPNLIESTSLSTPDLAAKYAKESFEIWETPLVKLFYLQLGKRSATPEGRALIRFLRSKIQPKDLLKGLSGFSATTQIFPRGYELYHPAFSCSNEQTPATPINPKRLPLKILTSPARVSSLVRNNLARVIEKVTGKPPIFINVPLEEVPTYRTKGDFDLYAGAIGLAEPDPDSLLSFLIEGDIPLIFPEGTDFLDRLKSIRGTKESRTRLSSMRSLLQDAQCEGHLLPLFHLATRGIGRKELDLSKLGAANESIRLSKIRFKTQDSGTSRRPQ